MGSLYWQLNDVWPVFSWASVDYFGQWKALHFRAREMYKDTTVFIFPNDNTTNNAFMVNVNNDYMRDISGSLVLDLVNYDGTLVKSQSQNVTLKQNSINKFQADFSAEL